MSLASERWVVDANGRRLAVVLELDEYRRLLEELEELEAIRAYDAAKAALEDCVPFEQAVAEIEDRH